MSVQTTYSIDLPGRRPMKTESAIVAEVYASDGARVTAISRGVQA